MHKFHFLDASFLFCRLVWVCFGNESISNNEKSPKLLSPLFSVVDVNSFAGRDRKILNSRVYNFELSIEQTDPVHCFLVYGQALSYFAWTIYEKSHQKKLLPRGFELHKNIKTISFFIFLKNSEISAKNLTNSILNSPENYRHVC